MARLRNEEVDSEEVAALVEMEKRSYELAVEENSFWLDVAEMAYQSRSLPLVVLSKGRQAL